MLLSAATMTCGCCPCMDIRKITAWGVCLAWSYCLGCVSGLAESLLLCLRHTCPAPKALLLDNPRAGGQCMSSRCALYANVQAAPKASCGRQRQLYSSKQGYCFTTLAGAGRVAATVVVVYFLRALRVLCFPVPAATPLAGARLRTERIT